LDLFEFQPQPWHWIVVGLVLAMGEMVLPTTFLLWFGIAGIATGLILLLFDFGFAYQLVLFAALAFASFFPIRWAARRMRNGEAAGDTLNRRGQSAIGQHLTVIEAIEDGFGAVKFGDSRWRASAEHDLPAGTKVEVVGIEGTTLKVVPIPGP